VRGLATEEVGRRAAAAGLTLYELTPVRSSLEAAYMEITKESVDYHSGSAPSASSASSTDGSPHEHRHRHPAGRGGVQARAA